MILTVTSPAFGEGERIPAKYTCDGSGISPRISWEPASGDVKSYALICDDPDAPMGTWVHWVAYNIPADVHELPEGYPTSDRLSDGTVQGMNGWGRTSYGGPCPPSGTHRYFFKVYALDTMLSIGGGATKSQLVAAMKGHGIAEGHLMGTYQRG